LKRKPRTLPAGLVKSEIGVDGRRYVVLGFASNSADDDAPPVDAQRALAGLTRAEIDVLRLLLEGKSSAEIAEARGTSERTVANQLAGIYRKFGVQGRTELIAQVIGER
jgi:DNA-binding CsgD family transcriptional regulator